MGWGYTSVVKRTWVQSPVPIPPKINERLLLFGKNLLNAFYVQIFLTFLPEKVSLIGHYILGKYIIAPDGNVTRMKFHLVH